MHLSTISISATLDLLNHSRVCSICCQNQVKHFPYLNKSIYYWFVKLPELKLKILYLHCKDEVFVLSCSVTSHEFFCEYSDECRSAVGQQHAHKIKPWNNTMLNFKTNELFRK